MLTIAIANMPATRSTRVPKSKTLFSTIAKNDVTGHAERISGDYVRFAQVGRPQSIKKPQCWKEVKTPHLDYNYVVQLLKDQQEELDNLAHLANLLSQRRLLDRISDPVPSLIQRMGDLSIDERHSVKPLPKDLKFRKSKIMSREEEYERMMEATSRRIEKVQDLLNEGRGINGELKKQGVEDLFRNFYDLEDTWKDLADKFTPVQWSWFRKDMKAVGKINLKGIAVKQSRWEEAISELAALGLENRFNLD